MDQVQLTDRNQSNLNQIVGFQTPSQSQPGVFKRLLKQSVIQPGLRQNQTCCQKFMVALDIFTFVPIPQSYPVSTKRSKIGSIILIALFLVYVIYDLVTFITNNPPRINSYNTGIVTNYSYPVPEMAIGFIYGSSLNNTLNDSNYFTISAVELQTAQGKGNQTAIDLFDCGNLTWMGQTQNSYQNLSCLNTTQAQLENILYISNLSYYPRFVVTLCNKTETKTCAKDKELQEMTGGGRIFLFVEQNQSINLATSKAAAGDQMSEFQFFNYFMVPGIYGRVVITLQPCYYIIYPDYLTSWTTKYYLEMQILANEYQVSNVTVYNDTSLFSISVLLSSQAKTIEVVYTTSIEHISLWGAFWGVLFGIFAIIFLAYNKRQFYRKRPDWVKFEEKVDELDQQREVLNREMENFRVSQLPSNMRNNQNFE